MRLAQIIDVDMEKERARIERCWEGEAFKDELLKLCDLFEQGHFTDCIALIQSWGYDEERECDKAEYVGSAFYDVLKPYMYGYKFIKMEGTTFQPVQELDLNKLK